MKKFLSLVLALVMTMSLVTVSAGAQDFNDSDKINYDEAVDVMSALKIIDGYSDGDFRPDGTLTRGAAAKIIACMMLGKTTAEALGTSAAPFKDVPVGSTFAGYLAYCVESGLIDGYADGTFRPSGTLTGFAFLKMLLTAMGYDSTVEGFTGSNWTVNVARLAIENGLTDGNDDFVGTRAATREEACLYAVNTIQAPLVQYENKGTSITINGVEIAQGASKAEVVTTTVANEQNISDKKVANTNYYVVEFGEKYMPRLVLTGDQDEFMRPSNTWYYKSAEIGTYAKTPDLTYTTSVSASDLYSDLGISKVDSDNNSNNGYDALAANVYVDGVVPTGSDAAQLGYKIERSNTSDKFGGNGVLTEVYKDENAVTIVEINTYVGDVTAKTAATTTRDAYVSIATRGNGTSGTFETTGFNVDDVVLYTFSYKMSGSSYEGIQSVESAPAKITGNLSEVTLGKKITVDEKSYDYSKKIANVADSTMLKFDVDVILDSYGYVIDVQPTSTNTAFAYVLNIKTNAGDFNTTNKAELLFTDGSKATVELTNAKSDNGKYVLDKDATNTYIDSADNSGVVIRVGDIVKYSVSNSGKYTLDRMVAANGATLTQASTPVTAMAAASANVSISNGSYTFSAAGGTPTYTANGKTLFLVASKSGNDTIYSVYEGIKNVPSIASSVNVNTTVYVESGVAKIVFVDATANTSVSTGTAIFLKPNSNLTLTQNSRVGNYYSFDAIVDGELQEDFLVSESTFASLADARLGGMFDGVYYDANNIATLSRSTSVVENGTNLNGTGKYYQETVTLDGTTYTYTSDAWFFYLDANGVLTKIGATSVTDDVNDLVYAKVNAGHELVAVVIKEVANPVAGFSVAGSTNVKMATTIAGLATATPGAGLTNVAAGSTVYVQADTSFAINTGSTTGVTLTAISGNPGVYSFVMPNNNITPVIATTANYVLTATGVAGTNQIVVTVNSTGASLIGTNVTVTVKKQQTTGVFTIVGIKTVPASTNGGPVTVSVSGDDTSAAYAYEVAVNGVKVIDTVNAPEMLTVSDGV